MKPVRKKTLPPVPSPENWSRLCYLWDIRTQLDLQEALELADRARDTDKAILVKMPELHQRKTDLRTRVKRLALAQPSGDLHGPLLPANTLQDLEPLPKLIAFDSGQLATWHVQKLLSQIHEWGFHGDEKAREVATRLANQIGTALALAVESGRPPAILQNLEHRALKVLEGVKKHLPRKHRQRTEKTRHDLSREFPDVRLASRDEEPGIPTLGYLQCSEAKPWTVTYRILADIYLLSQIPIFRLLNRMRQSKTH